MNKNRAFKKYKHKAEKLLQENDRVHDLISQSSAKLKSLINSNEKLKEFSDNMYTLFRMIRAQLKGEYKVMPWKTSVMIVGTLLYFVAPLDVIPDFIPGLGLTDDIAILYWIYNSILEDIEQFELWEKQNAIEIDIADEASTT